MTVKEIFNTHFQLANQKMEYKVVASNGNGGNIIYYSGNGLYLRKEVAKMEVYKWFIDSRQNFVIVVKRDKNFEEKRKEVFKK